LDCGGSTPLLSSSSALFEGGVELPQSKMAELLDLARNVQENCLWSILQKM
jgi:hypothetical protein